MHLKSVAKLRKKLLTCKPFAVMPKNVLETDSLYDEISLPC